MSCRGGIIINISYPLINSLLQYIATSRKPFHTPGHKGKPFFPESIGNFPLANMDLTELPGLDNLHQPQGIIAESQAQCARFLGIRDTFYLVNGASVGIQAAVLACTGPKDVILIPRNAHKSVTAGLILSGATPIYYIPEVHPYFGLPLGQAHDAVLPKLKAYPQAKAMLAVYPTYYGSTWDLAEVRRNWQGTLIVDEAHGAHFPFFESFPQSAVNIGADVVVHSSHKTLNAFTQAAMLHVGDNCKISSDAFLQALDILQTTSPSYLLLASLENAFRNGIQNSSGHWGDLVEGALELKNSLAKNGIRVLDNSVTGTFGIKEIDPLKILVNVPENKANETVQRLITSYGIQPELWDTENILFLLGAGDTRETIRGLEGILLKEIGIEHKVQSRHPYPDLPKIALTPREAYFSKKQLVPIKEAVGLICGETLSPYPPGVPAIVPGEIISKDMVDYIAWSKNQGIQWQGTSESQLDKILVIRETN